MNRNDSTHDALDKEHLDQEMRLLKKQLQEAAEKHRILAAEAMERSAMLPPSDLLLSAKMAKKHEEVPSRSEERVLRRNQRAGFLFLVVLIVAAAILFSWGFRIMSGG